MSAVPTVSIGSIVVSDRHRVDLGDLTDLAESIRELGLLQPVGVTPGHELLFGLRRLRACESLGWDMIPVRVIADLKTGADHVKAERDENTCRKDMTPSELVELGKALEELERPKARERQSPGTNQYTEEVAARGSRDQSGYTRNIVGGALGMSGITYERAKRVVEATQHLDPAIRAVAEEAKAEMDATGHPSPAYNKVRRAERAAAAGEPVAPPDGDRAHHPRLHHRDPATIAVRFLSAIAGTASAVRGLDFSACRLDPAQLAALDRDMQVILHVRRSLKGASK